MAKKSLLKFGIAFVLLAFVLIFLGVNYVPRLYASSSPQVNVLVVGKQTRINYIDDHYPLAISMQPSYIGVDWIERHPSSYYSNSDWIEHHPSNYYSNSDWIERHPSQPSQ